MPVLLVPFAAAVVAGRIADWTWPTLVNDHPLVLLGLSSQNRYLLLTAPQLGVVAFFVVAFFRLVLTDPITYLLGRQYGEDALGWIERRTSSKRRGESAVRRAERLFNRAAPVVIFVAPSAIFCLFAGAARMKVWVFATCNAAGTITRLAIFWIAADAFSDQLHGVLDAIERLQVPLLALTVSIGLIHATRSRWARRRPNADDGEDALQLAVDGIAADSVDG